MAKLNASRPRIAAGRFAGWRQALVLVALVAFALQGYVVQTHIHFTPAEIAKLSTGTHAVKFGSGEHHDKFPANDDPANCPICQEILHNGQFVTPAAQVLLPPAQAVSTIAIVDTALPFVLAFSHSWRGRAPPRI
jgi:hypothetical protein